MNSRIRRILTLGNYLFLKMELSSKPQGVTIDHEHENIFNAIALKDPRPLPENVSRQSPKAYCAIWNKTIYCIAKLCLEGAEHDWLNTLTYCVQRFVINGIFSLLITCISISSNIA